MGNKTKHFITDEEYKILEKNGISVDVFKSRLRKKWSRKRALNQVVHKRNIEPLPKDELLHMIKKGITYSIYRQRIEKGWAEHEAKTEPVIYKKGKNPYKQFTDLEIEYMVENYITYNDYKNRRKNGWSREEAIFIPKGIMRREIYKNELYPITSEDFKRIYQNGSTIDTYRTRRHLGWSHEDAITTPKRRKC